MVTLMGQCCVVGHRYKNVCMKYGGIKIDWYNIPQIAIKYWFLAVAKQLYEWLILSVCLPVHLSHLFHYASITISSWNFQKLSPMTKMRSMQNVKIRGKRPRSQRSKPNLNDEMMHKDWCCLGEVPYCFSRSSVKFQGHPANKNVDFDPNWVFPNCNSSFNSPMSTKWCTKLEAV